MMDIWVRSAMLAHQLFEPHDCLGGITGEHSDDCKKAAQAIGELLQELGMEITNEAISAIREAFR